MKKIALKLTLPTVILIVASLIITFLYPNVLKKLNITDMEAWTVIMNLISLLLLLYFFNPYLSFAWRIFCLLASFVILIESILMLGPLF